MKTTLPTYSFGTAAIGGLYDAVSYEKAQTVLDAAWQSGLRYYDTAPHYGQGSAERRLGDFLRDKPSSEWILSTKVGRILTPLADPPKVINSYVDPLPFAQTYDYTYDGIMRSFESSFHRLGLNRIDIVFVHDIGALTHGAKAEHHLRELTESGYRALAKLREAGIDVGLGVNEIEVCQALLGRIEMDVILLAGRYSLLDQQASPGLLAQCAANDVKLIIGGVFNSGILATGPIPGAYFDYAPASPQILAAVARLEAICNAHGVPLAAAALAFPLRAPQVASILIGTASVTSLRRNLDLVKEPIPDALWQQLAAEGLMQ